MVGEDIVKDHWNLCFVSRFWVLNNETDSAVLPGGGLLTSVCTCAHTHNKVAMERNISFATVCRHALNCQGLCKNPR